MVERGVLYGGGCKRSARRLIFLFFYEHTFGRVTVKIPTVEIASHKLFFLLLLHFSLCFFVVTNSYDFNIFPH